MSEPGRRLALPLPPMPMLTPPGRSRECRRTGHPFYLDGTERVGTGVLQARRPLGWALSRAERPPLTWSKPSQGWSGAAGSGRWAMGDG